MRTHPIAKRTVAALTVILLTVSACGLPRSGPTRGELLKGTEENGGDAFVVAVTSEVAKATDVIPPLSFSDAFLNAGVKGSDTINPGTSWVFRCGRMCAKASLARPEPQPRSVKYKLMAAFFGTLSSASAIDSLNGGQ